MKNKLIALSAIVAAIALSGCTTQPVDQPGSKRPEATWNSITGTLSDVRYYNSDVDKVYKAAEKALKELGVFNTGYDQTKRGYRIHGRALGDYKVVIDITSRTVSTKGTNREPIPYTEVSVSYGSWGELAPALQIVSKISRNLPSEK